MLEKLATIFAPFSVIARELTTLRELYELELAEKNIYRITEKPRPGDTQVFYGEEETRGRSKKLVEMVQEEIDAEDFAGAQGLDYTE